MSQKINLLRLRMLLNERLNSEELRELSFSLDVDDDNLAGNTKKERIGALINYLYIRNRLDDLFSTLRETRPDLNDGLDGTFIDGESMLDFKACDEAHKAILETFGQELRTIEKFLKDGQLMLIIGADLPDEITGLPDRTTLAQALAQQEMLEEDPASLAEVADLVMQNGYRFTFTQFLREQLSITGKQPAVFHRYVVGLAQENNLKIVISLAYDGLLEATFREADVPLSVVVNDNDLPFASQDRAMLLKLYGDWQQPMSLVVTQQDQFALLNGRNLEKQRILTHIKSALAFQAVLFVGYDLKDTAVNVLFDTISDQTFKLPAFAIWSGLTIREQAAWKGNRGLTVMDVDPVAFLCALLNL